MWHQLYWFKTKYLYVTNVIIFVIIHKFRFRDHSPVGLVPKRYTLLFRDLDYPDDERNQTHLHCSRPWEQNPATIALSSTGSSKEEYWSWPPPSDCGWPRCRPPPGWRSWTKLIFPLIMIFLRLWSYRARGCFAVLGSLWWKPAQLFFSPTPHMTHCKC